ncbi:MAG: hypothetical protein IPL61_34330 [Myxococcales bacterium]|nr:hypothetical protein [Myxococcales bacterium]
MSTLRNVTIMALALAVGCGGDDGASPDAAIDAPPVTAAEYEGLWLMTELVVGDPSAPQTLRRDGVTQALRADVQFTATGPRAGQLQVRQLVLAQGVPASPVMSSDHAVAVEDDRWLLTDADASVLVLRTARTGDHLALTHDPSDPRDTATDPPISVSVDRVAPWSTVMRGGWDLVSITVGGSVMVAGACVPVATDVWGTIGMQIDIDARLLFSRVMTTRLFSDAACTVETSTTSSTQLGLAEEEGGLHARIWGSEGDRHEYQAFDLTLAGADLTLTRTACLPQPACADSAPTEVVVRRRP